LRERREDIPLLVHHFVKKFSQSMNKRVPAVSDDALECLAHHDWPGNIRELQNAMERAVLVCRSDEITLADLPMMKTSSVPKVLEERSLAAIERDHIGAVLEETDWNISQSARLLKIDRVTLYNKIKRYGLKQERKGNAKKA